MRKSLMDGAFIDPSVIPVLGPSKV